MWIHTEYEPKIQKPSYLFRIQENFYARVYLLNSEVSSITYYSRDQSFLVKNIEQLLAKNCEGNWQLYDDGRGKATLKTWRVLLDGIDDSSLVAYALLFSKPQQDGYYCLTVGSGLWDVFLKGNHWDPDRAPLNI